MSKESWKSINGFEDRYEISNKGNVRLSKRDILDKSGNIVRSIDNVPVKIHRDDKEKYVLLYDGQKYHRMNVIDLVKNTFDK